MGSGSTRQLASEVGAARRARAWVRQVLPTIVTIDDEPGLPMMADAALCVSELVTASLVAQSTTMTLHLSRDHNTVRLSLLDDGIVADGEQGAVAHAQQLGFQMIDAIVERWGIEVTDRGRELWVALPVANGHK